MTRLLSASRDLIARSLAERGRASGPFFARESERLADVARRMADRFARGGRLLACGSDQAATDAQHVAVEFVHPVLVGKRALPAIELTAAFGRRLPALVRADDIVIGFAGPGSETQVVDALRAATAAGALVLALPGAEGDYAVAAPSPDPFVTQELIEVLYHTLWETVHVFFERQPIGTHGGAASSFLYPFLSAEPPANDVALEVAASIRTKARAVERLQQQMAAEQADAIAAAVLALRDRIDAGATVWCLGNGGSATDAADLALDLAAPVKAYESVAAVSLASDAATLTAVANDIGAEGIFVRQLMAFARAGDVVIAFSTSGGSANVLAALAEARRGGMLTVALVGYDGGEILRTRAADHVIVVPSDQIPRIQEVHASVYHVMVDALHAARGHRE